MNRLETQVEMFIRKHALLPDKSVPVISTLSGGADSVAMLAVLVRLGYKCVAAHCNFHLRGDESDRDEHHARTIAGNLGVEIVVKHFDVEHYRNSVGHPISVEMACRELRYEWFEQLRRQYEAQAIAVAHNADDNNETMLLNLFRGCGITGVRGMRPENGRYIVRPLLSCFRKEIEQYLYEKGLPYITDSTNLENDFRRNGIRNIVMPDIRRFFPSADKCMMGSIENLAENESFYRQCIEERRKLYMKEDYSIDLNLLTENECHAGLLLYEWLGPEGFTRSDINNMLDAHHSGRRFDTPGCSYYTDHGILRRLGISDDRSCSLENLFDITQHPISEFSPVNDPTVAYFDSKILRNGLWVRYRNDGDRIAPFGMRGTKKLSDLFNDAKLSLEMKDRVPLLMSGNNIVWAAGVRASRHYPVTDSTEYFIIVRYNGRVKN